METTLTKFPHFTDGDVATIVSAMSFFLHRTNDFKDQDYQDMRGIAASILMEAHAELYHRKINQKAAGKP